MESGRRLRLHQPRQAARRARKRKRFDEAILEDGGPSVTGSPDRVGPPLRTRQPAAVASRPLALPKRQPPHPEPEKQAQWRVETRTENEAPPSGRNRQATPQHKDGPEHPSQRGAAGRHESRPAIYPWVCIHTHGQGVVTPPPPPAAPPVSNPGATESDQSVGRRETRPWPEFSQL